MRCCCPSATKGDALFEIDSNGFETDTPRTKLQRRQLHRDPDAGQLGQRSQRPCRRAVPRQFGHHAGQRHHRRRRTTSASALNGSGTTPATLTARSVVLQCNATKYLGSGTITAAQVAALRSASGVEQQQRRLHARRWPALFINGANETAVTGYRSQDASTLLRHHRPGSARSATRPTPGTPAGPATARPSTSARRSTSCTSLPTT